jgi:hypothetical protein
VLLRMACFVVPNHRERKNRMTYFNLTAREVGNE